MKKNLLFSLVLLLSLVILSKCRVIDDHIKTKELVRLKQEYSTEAINFFYETVFWEDNVGRLEFISRWGNDIWLYLSGNLWPNDSIYVDKAVEQLNDLNLPVKLHLTNDSVRANLFVYFGDFDYLEQKIKIKENKRFRGTGTFTSHSSYIDSANVGIANNATSYSGLNITDKGITRQSAILEEITQVLGITGDSWMQPNSIFFEGKEAPVHLSKLDKEIIKLLYEPCFPLKYSRKEFEEDFQDVLYHKNATEKLRTFIENNNVPLSYLEYIRGNCFNDSVLIKFPEIVYVKIRGDYSQQDYEFCEKAVDLINTASERLQVKIEQDSPWNEVPCINILYNDSALINRVLLEGSFISDTMMFRRRLLGSIKLSYNISTVKDIGFINKIIFESIYKILALNDFVRESNSIIDIDSMGNLSFKPGYKEILSLLYNPVFPNSFTIEEMDEVIKSLGKY